LPFDQLGGRRVPGRAVRAGARRGREQVEDPLEQERAGAPIAALERVDGDPDQPVDEIVAAGPRPRQRVQEERVDRPAGIVLAVAGADVLEKPSDPGVAAEEPHVELGSGGAGGARVEQVGGALAVARLAQRRVAVLVEDGEPAEPAGEAGEAVAAVDLALERLGDLADAIEGGAPRGALEEGAPRTSGERHAAILSRRWPPGGAAAHAVTACSR